MGNRIMTALLRSPLHRLFGKVLMVLGVQGRKSGRWYRFPVQYLEDGGRLLIWVGNADRKRWWRNLETRPEVQMVLHGRERTGTARIIRGDATPEARAYAAAFPRLVRKIGGMTPDEVMIEVVPSA